MNGTYWIFSLKQTYFGEIMPVLVTADIPSVSPELYEKTHSHIMDGGRPDGMISHCCVEKGGHISVVDIWESREHFEAFASDKIAGAMQRYGIEGGPENLVFTELLNADAFDFVGNVLSE